MKISIVKIAILLIIINSSIFAKGGMFFDEGDMFFDEEKKLVCNRDNAFLICDDESGIRKESFYSANDRKLYIGFRGGASYVANTTQEDGTETPEAISIPIAISVGGTIGDYLRVEIALSSTASDFTFIETDTLNTTKIKPTQLTTNIIIDVPTLYYRVRHFGGIGIGLSKNKVVSYTSNEIEQNITNSINEDISWRVFAGISYVVSKIVVTEIMYSYSDYGNASFTATDGTQKSTSLKAHELLFGLRFRF
jgi:opacity protein-like surface antigen